MKGSYVEWFQENVFDFLQIFAANRRDWHKEMNRSLTDSKKCWQFTKISTLKEGDTNSKDSELNDRYGNRKNRFLIKWIWQASIYLSIDLSIDQWIYLWKDWQKCQWEENQINIYLNIYLRLFIIYLSIYLSIYLWLLIFIYVWLLIFISGCS